VLLSAGVDTIQPKREHEPGSRDAVIRGNIEQGVEGGGAGQPLAASSPGSRGDQMKAAGEALDQRLVLGRGPRGAVQQEPGGAAGSPASRSDMSVPSISTVR
jgi:hypothetical protein